MRRFALCLLISTLAACAAQAPQGTLAQQLSKPTPQMIAQAQRGDAQAQLALGDSYCDTSPLANAKDAPETLYWWKRAARGSDSNTAMAANFSLGAYYFGQFANIGYYQPGKSKPIALCRGDAKVKPDYARAEKYFTRCAKPGFHDKSCELALGHLHSHRGNYSKAYFWYATTLAYSLDNDFDNQARYPKRDEVLRLDHPGIANEMLLPYIRSVAAKLPKTEVERLNAKAQAYTRGAKPRG